MTHIQRYGAICILLAFAVSLHVIFFNWSTSEGSLSGYGPFVFSNLFCEDIEHGCLRIWYDGAAGDNFIFVIVAGVVAPLALVFSAIYLSLKLFDTPKSND